MDIAHVQSGAQREFRWLDQWAALIILLMIAAYVITVVGFNTCACTDQGNVAAAKAQIKQFETGIVAYAMKYGAVPYSMGELFNPPSGEPIFLSNVVPLDPWGRPYEYIWFGPREYEIVCYGADGKAGGKDEASDIRSDDLGSNEWMLSEEFQSNTE